MQSMTESEFLINLLFDDIQELCVGVARINLKLTGTNSFDYCVSILATIIGFDVFDARDCQLIVDYSCTSWIE
jgi:hypothetical protein